MTDLAGLLARVREATGPDRELDALLWCEFGWTEGNVNDAWQRVGPTAPDVMINGQTMRYYLERGYKNVAQHWSATPLSASIDAALALVERVMPGCGGHLVWGGAARNPFATLAPLRDGARYPVSEPGATPALAICAALLSALTAKAPPLTPEQVEP